MERARSDWAHMTGRAAGFCAGFGTPGFDAPRFGQGFGGGGRGRGSGRGRRRWFTGGSPFGLGWPSVAPAWPAPPYSPAPFTGMTRQQEIDTLKGQAEYLEGILDGLRRRIDELEPKTATV